MSEFRKDLVSGDWVIMAPERGKRPDELAATESKRTPSPKSDCPFENLKETGNWPPIEIYPAPKTLTRSDEASPNEHDWDIVVIPNKYPALRHDPACAQEGASGPHINMTGVGEHELVITRDHYNNFAHLLKEQADKVFEVFQRRYNAAKEDECLYYVSVFANWGERAGASVYHPHYQILSLPVIPTDIGRSLEGSRRYYAEHGKCVHCTMLEYERSEEIRIVAENDEAIAFAPYFSRNDYEVRIFPKVHASFFEEAEPSVRKATAELLQLVLTRMEENMGDPDVNFFIHTPPIRNQKEFEHYHWHIEILPALAEDAGFEFSTGMDINVTNPKEVARLLRGDSR